jgi:hypothetical protein
MRHCLKVIHEKVPSGDGGPPRPSAKRGRTLVRRHLLKAECGSLRAPPRRRARLKFNAKTACTRDSVKARRSRAAPWRSFLSAGARAPAPATYPQPRRARSTAAYLVLLPVEIARFTRRTASADSAFAPPTFAHATSKVALLDDVDGALARAALAPTRLCCSDPRLTAGRCYLLRCSGESRRSSTRCRDAIARWSLRERV